MSMFGNAQSMRWLIAEVTVVVLGILIAFQVEEWRSYRNDREVERAGLQTVIHDLDFASEQYEVYGQFLDMQRGQIVDLIELLQSPEEPEEEQLIKLLDFQYDYLWSKTQSAFISLRETGKLELISDDELRSELIEYFDSYEHYFQSMTEYHSRGKRRLVETLERDLKITPLPDYRSTRGYSTALRVSVGEFPTDPGVLTELINLDVSAAERRGLVDKGVVRVTNLRTAILNHLEIM